MNRADRRPDDRREMVKKMSRECVAVRIRLLSRLVTNIFDGALSPLGIKLTQLNILVVVYLVGEIGYDELCRRLKLEKSTASRNIERMKKKGWLDVAARGDERRKTLVVTEAGLALLDGIYEPWEAAQRKAELLLGDEGVHALCGVVNGIWRKDKAA